MPKIEDGGSALSGLTVRDVFALRFFSLLSGTDGNASYEEDMSQSYSMADDMMKARAAEPEQPEPESDHTQD